MYQVRKNSGDDMNKKDFQDQLILSMNGQVGDCFRACLATVIGTTSPRVPHFALLGVEHFIETAMAWLEYRGYETSIQKDDFQPEGLVAMPLHIIRGQGPRGLSHAVVGDTKTGNMVHDPHPSRAGLVEIHSRFYLFKK